MLTDGNAKVACGESAAWAEAASNVAPASAKPAERSIPRATMLSPHLASCCQSALVRAAPYPFRIRADKHDGRGLITYGGIPRRKLPFPAAARTPRVRGGK